MKIFLIAGKARHGKNTIADIIQKYYEEQGKKVIQTAYAKYIRMYAKEVANWDGISKPRDLFDKIGTEIIRQKLKRPDFFTNRMLEDISVYKNFADVVIINAIRFPIEIDEIKKYHSNAVSLEVKRINFESDLTSHEQMHETEISLDNYDKYDYKITNDTLEQLQEDVINILKGIDKNE